jgi:hypothetical protein
MAELNSQAEAKPRDADYWAKPVDKLHVGDLPTKAINLNVEGRQVTGPLQGFGQLWQKTYLIRMVAPRVRMTGEAATPQDVVRTWKENFPKFWPRGNNFYSALTSIQPGNVAVLNLPGPGGLPISTGILVIYSDDEQFSFMTPQGHMFAGMITFSSFDRDDHVHAQIQVLIRANDPMWEALFMAGITRKMEDTFWEKTLHNLAAEFGTADTFSLTASRVDPRWQWSNAKNIWHNAAIRSSIYVFLSPFRWVGGMIAKSEGKA